MVPRFQGIADRHEATATGLNPRYADPPCQVVREPGGQPSGRRIEPSMMFDLSLGESAGLPFAGLSWANKSLFARYLLGQKTSNASAATHKN